MTIKKNIHGVGVVVAMASCGCGCHGMSLYRSCFDDGVYVLVVSLVGGGDSNMVSNGHGCCYVGDDAFHGQNDGGCNSNGMYACMVVFHSVGWSTGQLQMSHDSKQMSIIVVCVCCCGCCCCCW